MGFILFIGLAVFIFMIIAVSKKDKNDFKDLQRRVVKTRLITSETAYSRTTGYGVGFGHVGVGSANTVNANEHTYMVFLRDETKFIDKVASGSKKDQFYMSMLE